LGRRSPAGSLEQGFPSASPGTLIKVISADRRAGRRKGHSMILTARRAATAFAAMAIPANLVLVGTAATPAGRMPSLPSP